VYHKGETRPHLTRAWKVCVYEMRIRPIEMIPMLWFKEKSADVFVDVALFNYSAYMVLERWRKHSS
jgi:hypothetical protein